jgi:hypothetical protein
MTPESRAILWRQFGAAIDMLEGAMAACPDQLWFDRSRRPEFWYVVFHTLFWLDFYASAPAPGYTPPAPFGLEEMDPAGVLPPRPYSKAELQRFLEHARSRCRGAIAALADERGRERYVFGPRDMSLEELFLYGLRHVQHHAGQLHLMLRQATDSTPGWVSFAKTALDAP